MYLQDTTEMYVGLFQGLRRIKYPDRPSMHSTESIFSATQLPVKIVKRDDDLDNCNSSYTDTLTFYPSRCL